MLSAQQCWPLLLVGAGRMGGALLEGWLAGGADASAIVIEDPQLSPEMAEFGARYGVKRGLAALTRPPRIAVLAVKPQIMDAVLPNITPICGPETLLVSIAAGRSMASIAAHFPPGAAIVRAMPNTPVSVGRGMSAMVRNGAATDAQAAACEALFSAAGACLWLEDEALIDAATAISGSGPAYIFHLAECLAEAGEALGLSPTDAAELARATISGAGELLHRSPLSSAQLRENVTSPGGTTAAALAVLMAEPSLKDIMQRAAQAAAKRARELSA